MDSAAPTLKGLKLVSAVQEKLLTRLAELLVRSQSLPDLIRDLDRHGLDHQLRPNQGEEEVLDALKYLLWNYPYILQEEDQVLALELPEHLQGERVLDSLLENTSNEDA